MGEIENNRLFFEVSKNAEWLTNIRELSESGSETKLLSSVFFSAGIEKIGGQVCVSGELSFELVCPCSRCVKPAKTGIRRQILSFLPLRKGESKIDISDNMREQVAMAMPEKTVCAENCKGLCMICGEDLNEKICNCLTNQTVSKFSMLKKINLASNPAEEKRRKL